MPLLTVDFETYYDKEYSLSKLTTEQYIRDDRFEVIGVSVKQNNSTVSWFSGTKEETKTFLMQFPWADSIALAHNALFDGAILSWIFDIHPRVLADTLSMSRPLHGIEVGGSLAKLVEHYGVGVKGTEVQNALGKRRVGFTPEELAAYGRYCCNDTELTYKLFQKMVEGFPPTELKLIDLTLKMFTEPVLRLDALLLEQHLHEVRQKKEVLLASLFGSVEDEEEKKTNKKSLMSNAKFAQLLIEHGVNPPTKISARTGKPTFAFAKTDQAMKNLLEHPDVGVQTLVGVRLGVKSTIEETRTERFLDIAQRGPLPIPLKYFAAHTGRWGGCLVADTEVTVYNLVNGVETKRIVDVLLDDLVWDGEAFVPHEGVVFSGFSEVIEWDGVKGTEDHAVFTDAGEISLREAMQGQHKIKVGGCPSQDDVDTARLFVGDNKRQAQV
jgi:DNA polymerase